MEQRQERVLRDVMNRQERACHRGRAPGEPREKQRLLLCS